MGLLKGCFSCFFPKGSRNRPVPKAKVNARTQQTVFESSISQTMVDYDEVNQTFLRGNVDEAMYRDSHVFSIADKTFTPLMCSTKMEPATPMVRPLSEVEVSSDSRKSKRSARRATSAVSNSDIEKAVYLSLQPVFDECDHVIRKFQSIEDMSKVGRNDIEEGWVIKSQGDVVCFRNNDDLSDSRSRFTDSVVTETMLDCSELSVDHIAEVGAMHKDQRCSSVPPADPVMPASYVSFDEDLKIVVTTTTPYFTPKSSPTPSVNAHSNNVLLTEDLSRKQGDDSSSRCKESIVCSSTAADDVEDPRSPNESTVFGELSFLDSGIVRFHVRN